MTYAENNQNNQENAPILEVSKLASLEQENITPLGDKDVRLEKLRLANAGFSVQLDPDEAEASGLEEVTLAEARESGYSPEAIFSPEELESAVTNGDFEEIAFGLLEKIIVLVTGQLRIVRQKKEAFFDLSDEDKKEFDKLNFTINELERLQKQIPSQTKEENYALIIEWGELFNAEDGYESLWERLDKEGEKGRRRDAIEGTNANFELEGEYRSEEAQERAERFINLELTEEEYFKDASQP